MPKIFLMQHNPLLENEVEEIRGKQARILRCKKTPGKQIMMFGCQCRHMEHNHLNSEKCVYNPEWCDCKKFVPIMFDLRIEITSADIFEFENPNHSVRDSLQWWSEFSTWKNMNGEN